MEGAYFSWQDYVVLFVTLSISAAIGFYYACTGGKQKTTKEYYLADGQMHWFPVACSLLASFISSQTLIGSPAEVYSFGTIVLYQTLGTGVGTIIGFIFYLPVFKQSNVISVFQYIELRYNRPMKFIALLLTLINMMLYASLVIYGPALSISAVTGIDLWLAVLSIALVGILYTLLGGLKAVLMTDSLQLVIMFIGVLIVLIYGSVEQGGFANVWEANKLSGRLDFIDSSKVFDFDPRMRHTLWGCFINMSMLFLNAYGVSQTSVQRYLSLRSKEHTIIAYSVTAVGLVVLSVLSCLIGMVIFSYYKLCDPISTGEIFSKDQIYPLYVMRLLGHLPGLPGLILSSVFSGSLSTVSSLFNSGALVILQDFIRPFKPNLSEKHATIISKILVLVLGGVAIVLVLFARYFGAGLMSMGLAIAGVFGGPVLALFTAGILLPIVNGKGAAVGFVIGSAYSGLIGLGALVNKPYIYKYPVTTVGCNITDTAILANLTSPIYDPSTWDPKSHYRSGFDALFDISYTWTTIGAVTMTTLMSLIFSYVFAKEDDPLISHKLLSPYLLRTGCLMPKSWRARIDFGDKSEEAGADNKAISGMSSDEMSPEDSKL